MERDFTETLQQELLNMVDTYQTWLSLQDTAEELEAYLDYLDNWQDMEYAMNHIETHKQYMIQNMCYDANTINEIFTEVREYDNTYPETISTNASTFFDLYIETLNGLIDAITVKDGDSPYTTTELYAMSAREQYGKWGSMSSNYGGLLNNSGGFSQQVNKAGTGINVYYEAIDPTVNGWENMDALLAKDPKDLHAWELEAVSRYLDTLIIEDAEGNVIVDTAKYEEFLQHCYTLKDFDTHEWHKEGIIYEAVAEYELYPSVSLLSNYRQVETQAYFNQNGQYIFTSGYGSEELQLLRAKAQVNDILLGCSLYGQSVTEVYDEDNVIYSPNDNITLNIAPLEKPNTNPVEYSTSDYKIDFYSQEDIILYGLGHDLNGKIKLVCDDITEDKKKDPEMCLAQQVIWTGVDHTVGLVTDIYCPPLGLVWSGATSANDCFSAYDSAQEYNEALQMVDDVATTNHYIETLHMGGTVIQCGDSYTINNIVCNETQLNAEVNNYNSYHPGNTVSASQLIDCFNEYVETGEAGILEGYSNSDVNDIGDPNAGSGGN